MAMIRMRPALARAWHAVRDARVRSELATALRFRRHIHQDTSVSWPDRYPRLFAAARDRLAGRSAPNILSFGCAAGEEVVTLRGYFPDAMLTGAELNRALLRACRRLPADSRRRFIASSDAAIAAHGPYDAIFCMAVLTRRPHEVEDRDLRNIAAFYPFAHFAQALRFLAAQLAPGGLLVVEHALYRAEDALAGTGVEPVLEAGVGLAGGARFGPDGERIEPRPVIARIFRRRA